MAITTSAYSVRLRVRLFHVPGTLGRLTTAIGQAGGNITSFEGFEIRDEYIDRQLTVDARSEEHIVEICDAVARVHGVELLEWGDRTFEMHEGGKLETVPRVKLRDAIDLSMAYTPGVARISMAISQDPERVHELTLKRNTVAVITDGSAVLGLGDIGPGAALPVMEGKSALFKEFGGVDSFPLCLDVSDVDEFVETVVRVAPVFGGINLEDIAAPRCFEIEARLRERLDIPVFHDDQHGTAIVVLAALTNAVKVVDKELTGLSVVIAGAGAAGTAIAIILADAGITDVVVADSQGAIHRGRDDLNPAKRRLLEFTNPRGATGSLARTLVGADVFIGVSAPDIITRDDVLAMADQPLVFGLSNPNPEIDPSEVRDIVGVIATGRSDYPNQINNVLAFPGVFRGALDAGATAVTEGMKLAAAGAIASLVAPDELTARAVIPSAFDRRVAPLVAAAVAEAAHRDGVCR
jgi:malate dehydrogenase (oxaloacetate-decarboxylating)